MAHCNSQPDVQSPRVATFWYRQVRRSVNLQVVCALLLELHSSSMLAPCSWQEVLPPQLVAVLHCLVAMVGHTVAMPFFAALLVLRVVAL